MVGNISPIDKMIKGIEPIVPKQAQPAAEDAGSPGGFGAMLRDQLDSVVDLHNKAGAMQQDFLMGKVDDISEVVLAVQKADLALNFAIELRNKVVEAYQEISRTQL